MTSISEIIKQIANQADSVQLAQGVVRSVDNMAQDDKDKCVCKVAINHGTPSELILDDVRFNVVHHKRKLTLSGKPDEKDNIVSTYTIPAVGAYVLLIKPAQTDTWYVLHSSKTQAQFLNGDAFGGLVKVEVLTERLNAIEDFLNNFLEDFKKHTHELGVPTFSGTIGGQPASGTVTGATKVYSSSLQKVAKTERKKIENANVKHG
jgi:hypothetical protein